jgi:arylsulfatase A-like enzyme
VNWGDKMRVMKYLIGFAIALLSVINCVNGQSLTATKPNVIIILADDMSYYDLSGLGQIHFSTPNLDRLLKQGLFFSEAYAGACECAPSRASLLTGKHMGHCTVRENVSVRGQEHLLNGDITIAEMLKEADYTTGMVGKWGVGLPGTEGVPNRQGFDYSCGFYDQSRAHSYYPFYIMENDSVIPIPENYGYDMNYTYIHARSPVGLHNYNEDGILIPEGVSDPAEAVNSQLYIHEKAISFIEKNYKSPFLLYYATQLPHGPTIVPDLGEYKDKPWDQKHKEWAAMIGLLDKCVGDIMQTLEKSGITKNTVIFFASDNGYSEWGYFNRKNYTDDPLFRNKGPWKGGKFIPLDGGARIPFFATWPGKIKSGYSHEVVALYDLLATACDLAGVDPPDNDGKSLVPILEGKDLENPLHDYLYWESGSHNTHAQSARFGNWFAYRDHPDDSIQVWDVSTDISCLYDVSPEHKDIVSEALRIFTDAHSPSEWYIEPGESKESIEKKRERVRRENSYQKSIRANSVYPWELDF